MPPCTLFVDVPEDWRQVYVWAMDSEGNKIFGEQPGIQIWQIDGWYSTSIPDNLIQLTLSDGSSHQVSVTDFTAGSDLYITFDQNDTPIVCEDESEILMQPETGYSAESPVDSAASEAPANQPIHFMNLFLLASVTVMLYFVFRTIASRRQAVADTGTATTVVTHPSLSLKATEKLVKESAPAPSAAMDDAIMEAIGKLSQEGK